MNPTLTTQTTTTESGNQAGSLLREATMANLQVGSVVRNFNTTAKVVGFFHRDFQNDTEGWPILRVLSANGRLRGGKWVADPSKCEAAN